MFVKGEGTARNVTAALELYTRAASNHSAQALNGLGYLYFYGVTDDAAGQPVVLLPANHTTAFAYFSQAANTSGADGDAAFNVAYCLEHGLGVARDFHRALQYYTHATTLGHFQSVKMVGEVWMTGGAPSLWKHCRDLDAAETPQSPAATTESEQCVGRPRNARLAKDYLKAARELGPWAQNIRRGLDLFLASGRQSSLSRAGLSWLWNAVLSPFVGKAREPPLSTSSMRMLRQALHCYLYAADLGYEVGASNAIFLLQRLVATSSSSSSSPSSSSSQPTSSSSPLPSILLSTLTTHLEVHNRSEAAFHLAGCFLSPELCALPRRDDEQALRYLELAAWMSPPYPLAYVYLGLVHHFQLLDLPSGSYGRPAFQLQQARYYYTLSLAHVQGLQDTASQAVPWTWLLNLLLWSVDHAEHVVWQPLQWILRRLVSSLWTL